MSVLLLQNAKQLIGSKTAKGNFHIWSQLLTNFFYKNFKYEKCKYLHTTSV